MGDRLKGEVAIVTGAAAGIGQAFSVAMAAEGASLVLADLVNADETVAKIEAVGGKAIAIIADVTDEAAMTSMASVAIEAFGKIDILVNNAGIYPLKSIEDTDLDTWHRIIGINLTGTFLATRAVVPSMKQAGKGKIVNISSGTFFMGTPGASAYVATKGAVIGMARSLAAELGSDGIQVNCIAPGLTTTPGVTGGIGNEMRDAIVTMQAVKRREVPEDMVGALLFLTSSDSDFMTGQVMLVDGGAANN